MPLTEQQETHLRTIKQTFDIRVDHKYRKGALEHGGNLENMSFAGLIDNAIDEAIDLITYLTTLKDNYTKLRKMLDEMH